MKRRKRGIGIFETIVYILLGSLLLIGGICSIRLFTGSWIVFSEFNKYSTSSAADVSNIIYGLTAPFFGLFGTLILIATFRRQTDANKTLREEIEISNFFKSYYEILRLIDTTEKSYKLLKPEDKEINCIQKGRRLVPDTESRQFDNLFTFIRLFEEISQSIEMFIDPNDNFNFCNSQSEFNYKKVIRLKALTIYHPHVESIITEIIKFKDKNKSFSNNSSFVNLVKSAEIIHDRCDLTNQKFWGINTKNLVIEIPLNNERVVCIKFYINTTETSKVVKSNISIQMKAKRFIINMNLLIFILLKFIKPKLKYHKIHVGNYVSTLSLKNAYIDNKIKNISSELISFSYPYTFNLKTGNNYIQTQITEPKKKTISCMINIMRAK